jgi:hypothetical protein
MATQPLRVWMYLQSLRSAQERAAAEQDYRKQMLDWQRKRFELQANRPISGHNLIPYKGGAAFIDEQGKIHPVPGISLPSQQKTPRLINIRNLIPYKGGLAFITDDGQVHSVPGVSLPQPKNEGEKAYEREKARLKARQEMWPRTRIGELRGVEIVHPDGKLWNRNDTIEHASANGALALTPKEAEDYRKALAARIGVLSMLPLAQKALPEKPGLGVLAGPAHRWMRERLGDPVITAFNASRIKLIEFARPIMGTLRVNQKEYNLALGGIENAQSFDAFKEAIKQIVDVLDTNIRLMQQEGADALKSPGSELPAISSPTEESLPAGYKIIKPK